MIVAVVTMRMKKIITTRKLIVAGDFVFLCWQTLDMRYECHEFEEDLNIYVIVNIYIIIEEIWRVTLFMITSEIESVPCYVMFC